MALAKQRQILPLITLFVLSILLVGFYHQTDRSLNQSFNQSANVQHSSCMPHLDMDAIHVNHTLEWIPFSNTINNTCIDQRFCKVMQPLYVLPCYNNASYMMDAIRCGEVIISRQLVCEALSYRSKLLVDSATAVIVLMEGREQPIDIQLIEFTLRSAIQHSPAGWRIRLFIKPFVIQQLNRLDWFISLTRICDKIIVHELHEGVNDSRAQYNKFIGSTQFWHSLAPASRVQLIETDSGFCDHSTRSIEQYLQFDFCGARWIDNHRWACRPNTTRDDTRCVGNSGFSIWNRFAMLFLTTKFEKNVAYRHNETLLIDHFWVEKMSQFYPGANICPPEEADLFSSETIMVDSGIPIGFHKPLQHFWTADQRNRFLAVCPDYHAMQSIRHNVTVTSS